MATFKKLEVDGKLCRIVSVNEFEVVVQRPPGKKGAQGELKTIPMEFVAEKMRKRLLQRFL